MTPRAASSSYRPRRRVPAGTWSAERVLAALRDWAAEFDEAPKAYEWSPSVARSMGIADARVHRWESKYPRWPGASTVTRYFGSWSAALKRAGLGEGRAGSRKLSLPERVETARRISAEGASTPEMASALNVSSATVEGYLSARPCPDCGAPVVHPDSARCMTCAGRSRHPRWTRDGIVEALRAWVTEEGQVPRWEDWAPTPDPACKWAREYPRWPSNFQVRRAFGLWSAAVEAAGLRTRRAPWDRESVAAALREFAREHGRAPTTNELRASAGLPSRNMVRKLWAGLGTAYAELGLEPSGPHWDRERVIAAMREFAREHGRAPKASEWHAPDPRYPYPETVARHLGSWGAALEAAGLKSNRSRWDRESIVEAARRYAAEHGRPPTARAWLRADPAGRRPTYHTVLKKFGAFELALEAAGLRGRKRRGH